MPIEPIYQTTISQSELDLIRKHHANESRSHHDHFMATSDESARAKSQYHFDRWQHLCQLKPLDR